MNIQELNELVELDLLSSILDGYRTPSWIQ